MKLWNFVVAASASLLIATTTVSAKETSRFDLLVDWMQGHFNSEQQSKDDKDFFNIHLNMKQVWKGKTSGTWIYVEQAADGYLDKPYRQRVYELKQLSDNEFVSVIYTFENPMEYAGAYKNENPLANLSPEKIAKREGCAVYLKWREDSQTFEGSTKEKACLSNLRGATYATSIVTVSKEGIVSWDQGWDANDKQVWGATKAGYIFLKQ